MSVRDELYIEELHASVNELEQELETTHRANKMLSDEKEKNRQEHIKLYQKLEAIRGIIGDPLDFDDPYTGEAKNCIKILEVLDR